MEQTTSTEQDIELRDGFNTSRIVEELSTKIIHHYEKAETYLRKAIKMEEQGKPSEPHLDFAIRCEEFYLHLKDRLRTAYSIKGTLNGKSAVMFFYTFEEAQEYRDDPIHFDPGSRTEYSKFIEHAKSF